MDNLLRIYTDFLSNYFSFLLLARMTENALKKKLKTSYVIFYSSLYMLYSIPEHIVFAPTFSVILALCFIYFAQITNFRKLLCLFFKYEFISYASITISSLLLTLLIQDWDMLLERNPTYNTYRNIIFLFLAYIFYVLYTNTKKMKDFHTHYQLSFNLVILSISLMLSYVTLYICRENSTTYALPAIFSTIALLIIVCISLYDKFLALVEENTRNKIQSEIHHMEKEYSNQIESNLAELHSIRHDMKNHLIIIDGYATQQNYEKIHAYIQKISGRFQSSLLIDTPSSTVSALLNEKYHIAKNKALECRIHTNFPYVHIDDFSIITILGNLFDNALTAASKCESGWIHVDISQSDSYLEIAMENNHIEKIQEKNGNFISTKEDKNLLHGIGLKNVRQAVDTLNGQISISHTAETFHVNILVPNY